MTFVPNEAEQKLIRQILARGETAVVLEAADGDEILGVANYPRTCREYYVGRLVRSVFRSEHDLEARLALARVRAGMAKPASGS